MANNASKSLLALSILILCLSIVVVLAGHPECDRGQHWSTRNNSCMICEANTYNSQQGSAESCAPCRANCVRNARKVSACNSTSDIVCECNDGYYFTDSGQCYRHTKCSESKGYVVIVPGNSNEDTKCALKTTSHHPGVTSPSTGMSQGEIKEFLGDIQSAVLSTADTREQNQTNSSDLPYQISTYWTIFGVTATVFVVVVVVIVFLCKLIPRKKRTNPVHDTLPHPRQGKFSPEQSSTRSGSRSSLERCNGQTTLDMAETTAKTFLLSDSNLPEIRLPCTFNNVYNEIVDPASTEEHYAAQSIPRPLGNGVNFSSIPAPLLSDTLQDQNSSIYLRSTTEEFMNWVHIFWRRYVRDEC